MTSKVTRSTSNTHTISTRTPCAGRLPTWAAALLATTAAACGTDGGTTEPTGVSQAAFGVEPCALASPDKVFAHKIDPVHVSPRSYDTCYKGYVVDITDLDEAYTGSGTARDARIAVKYADTAITSKATCEASKIMTAYYVASSGGGASTNGGLPGGWTILSHETQYGLWSSSSGGSCSLEKNFMGMSPGLTFRIAATARNPSNSTRKLSIVTQKPLDWVD